ncbi:MAG: hypothetical protein ACYCUM_07910 [Solirubrobacteraceae bacterium]
MNLVETFRYRGRHPGPLDVYFGNLTDEALSNAESLFFCGLQLANGMLKATAAHRLDDLNAFVMSLLPREQRLEIIDVAASSGLATAAWSDQLYAAAIDHQITASDLTIEGILMTIGKRVAVLWQKGGHPLVVQIGPRCAYLLRTSHITRLLRPPLAAVYPLIVKEARMASYETPPSSHAIRIRRVGLISRQLAARAQFRIIQDDISKEPHCVQRFDVCRAANILNRSAFSDDAILSMVDNLFSRLRDGGLLVVCRTHHESGKQVNRATVLRKIGDTREVVAQLNGGSDVIDLLITSKPHPGAAVRRYGDQDATR